MPWFANVCPGGWMCMPWCVNVLAMMCECVCCGVHLCVLWCASVHTVLCECVSCGVYVEIRVKLWSVRSSPSVTAPYGFRVLNLGLQAQWHKFLYLLNHRTSPWLVSFYFSLFFWYWRKHAMHGMQCMACNACLYVLFCLEFHCFCLFAFVTDMILFLFMVYCGCISHFKTSFFHTLATTYWWLCIFLCESPWPSGLFSSLLGHCFSWVRSAVWAVTLPQWGGAEAKWRSWQNWVPFRTLEGELSNSSSPVSFKDSCCGAFP